MIIKKFRFDLKEYMNETRKGFIFYDTLVNLKKIKKLDLLKEVKIPVTSYRIAEKKEQANGKKILLVLGKHFKLNSLTQDKINQYEEILSDIYYDVYYLNMAQMKKHEEVLEECIEDNNILSSIFKLFKILLIFTNDELNYIENRKKCKKLYESIKKFYDFFTFEIQLIYIMVECLMNDDILDISEVSKLISKTPYFKAMLYAILTKKSFFLKDYEKTIIYGNVCDNEVIKEQNFKRLWEVNLYMIVSLNAIKHFEEAYHRSVEKLLSMQSFNIIDNRYEIIRNNYYIASIGINKDDEILKLLINKEGKTVFDYLILILISYKKKEKNAIMLYYDEILKITNKGEDDYKISKSIYNTLILDSVKYGTLSINPNCDAGYAELIKINVRMKKKRMSNKKINIKSE